MAVMYCSVEANITDESIERLASDASYDLCSVLSRLLPTALSQAPTVTNWGCYGARAIGVDNFHSNVCKDVQHTQTRYFLAECTEVLDSKLQGVGLVVHPVGSAVNGFGTAASDLDLVVFLSDATGKLITSHSEYEKFYNSLRSEVVGKKSDNDLLPHGRHDLDREQDYAVFVLRRFHELLQDEHAQTCVGRGAHDRQRSNHLTPKERVGSMSRMRNFEVLELVSDARIPILRLSWQNIPVDVSFGNLEPLRNTQLLRTFATWDVRVRPLCSALKTWARQQNLCGAKHGYLCSYAFTLMCIYFLQVGLDVALHDYDRALPLPSMAAMCPDWDWNLEACGAWWQQQVFQDRLKDPIGDQSIDAADQCLLPLLFRFYAHDFRWDREVVSIRSSLRVEMGHPDVVALRAGRYAPNIEDPFLINRNLSCHIKSAAHSRALKKAFEVADCLEHLRICELSSGVACYMCKEVAASTKRRSKDTKTQLAMLPIARESRDRDRAKQVASNDLMKRSIQLTNDEYFAPNEEVPCFQCKRKGVKGRATIWKRTARWFCQRCWTLWDRQLAKVSSSKLPS